MHHYSWKQIIVLGLNALFIYTGVYSLSAYMPQLIWHLGVPRENIGYQVGAANNIMYASAALGTLTSGFLPSFIDSKRLLVVTMALQGIFSILYGFSDSITYLFTTLITLGFFGGAASVIIRTVISKKCTGPHQSYLLTWTMSGPITMTSALSPSLAGYLSVPAEKYPWLFSVRSAFKLFPILLFQLFLGGCLLLMSLVSYYVVNDECLSHEKVPHMPDAETKYTLLQGEEGILESNINGRTLLVGETDQYHEKTKLKLLIDDILTNPSYIGSALVGALFAACDVAYISLAPVWLQASRSNHGRDYNSNEISNILIVSGTITAVANYTILGKINTMLHPKVGLSIWITLVMVCVTITPILSCISDEVIFNVVYLPVNIIFNVCVSAGYTPTNLMSQNSVPVAATAIMWSSSLLLSRLIEGSLSNAVTSLFAWSIEDDRTFPFDYHLAFFCLGVTFLLSYVPTVLIRFNIEQRP